MNRESYDKLLVCLIVILILVLIIATTIFIKKESDCVLSPFVYGAEQMKKANGNIEFSCTCSFNKPGSPTLAFNSTNLWNIDLKNISFYIGK